MARYTGPVCRLCRREGQKLFLKGERCLSPKCPFEKDRGYPPGDHGRMAHFRRRRHSDYSRQLREKQKARRVYGVLERQFRRFFREAERRSGMAGENLLALLESRLDNVVYRAGFASSRSHARQLVQHGHFMVNRRRTTIPSFIVRPEDTVSVRDESRVKTYFKGLAQDGLDGSKPPNWLSLDPGSWAVRMLMVPARDQIDTVVDEQLIVEFYSR